MGGIDQRIREPRTGHRGTGDVLTGVVGALLARGLAPWDAARLAVYLHGAAGDAPPPRSARTDSWPQTSPITCLAAIAALRGTASPRVG